jgi:hypothetical protein
MEAVAKDMKGFKEATEKVVGDPLQVMVEIENTEREGDWVVILLPHCNRQVKAVHSCFKMKSPNGISPLHTSTPSSNKRQPQCHFTSSTSLSAAFLASCPPSQ